MTNTERKRAIYLRALKVSAIVGTLLAIINYTDRIYLGNMTTVDWVKLCITYVVPYCVSLFSGLSALKSAEEAPKE